jgi:hypothetical protein
VRVAFHAVLCCALFLLPMACTRVLVVASQMHQQQRQVFDLSQVQMP